MGFEGGGGAHGRRRQSEGGGGRIALGTCAMGISMRVVRWGARARRTALRGRASRRPLGARGRVARVYMGARWVGGSEPAQGAQRHTEPRKRKAVSSAGRPHRADAARPRAGELCVAYALHLRCVGGGHGRGAVVIASEALTVTAISRRESATYYNRSAHKRSRRDREAAPRK